jgi:hypothetical protein
MIFLRYGFAGLLITIMGLVGFASIAYDQDATPEVTLPAIRDCTVTPEATPAVEAVSESTETPVPEVTLEPTVTGSQDADAPLHFDTFTPTDVNFNPDKKQPVVIIMVFSLVFQNQLNQSIEVRSPRFQLAIDGVPWGDVASTDFQTGQLLANGTQGIVLQSLTFVNNATDAQRMVLTCIENERPVDLTLTGTIDVTVDDKQQIMSIELTSPDVIIRARKAHS